MTTGPPLYLVSACGSAEEFVAAFRRYADRTGLFVPSASPLPAGRRGRLAITLKDGGVMIEGEAEILQSSAKPTVLHGRPGMTVKFVEPDEPSKLVIGELEKARLAMKPAPPSVPPRPAQIPAEPRPVPPAPSGRIDAANALAECVVIGDVTTLRDTANSPKPIGGASANDKSGSKFIVPSIPGMGGPRAKTPSAAGEPIKPAERPAPVARVAPAPLVPPPPAPIEPAADKSGAPAKSEADRSRMTSIGFPALDKLPAKSDSGRVSNATTLGMPALGRNPDPALLATKTGTEAPPNPTAPMAAQNPLLETKLGHSAPPAASAPVVHDEKTTIGPAPPAKKTTDPTIPATPFEPIVEDESTTIGAVPVKKITDPMPVATPPLAATLAATAATADSNPRRSEAAKQQRGTSIGFPVVRHPFQTQPLGVVPPASPFGTAEPREPAPPTLPKSTGRQPAPGPRGKNPTTPPLTPRHPTPVAPVPIVRPPAKAAPLVADEEQTDLANAPTGIPAEVIAAPSSGAVAQPAQRSGGMRASEILAAIPAGDWTMTPDESIPHPLPPEAKAPGNPVIPEPTPAPGPPPGPPTGDWTISLDPEKGWSEPAKLKKDTATGGNPVGAVSSDKPIDVVQWDEKPTGIGESKIEIDSTLMEAQKASSLKTTAPQFALNATMPQTALPDGELVPPRLTAMPPRPTSGFTYPTRSSGGSSAALPGSESAKRKKMLAMAIGAGAVAVGAIVILVLTLSGQDKPASNTVTPGNGSEGSAISIKATPTPIDAAEVAEPGAGSQQVLDKPGSGSEIAPPADAAPQVTEQPRPPPAEDPAPAATGTCNVQLTSVPVGADIYVDKQKLGTTPGKLELPCGKPAKLSLRKTKFANTIKTITPQAGKPNKVSVRLGRNLVSVKVTSLPAGATITAGGKSMGVTPTTIKLPAFDTSTITLTKPGYSADKSRVTPKQNNASHHVTLKRGR